MRKRENYLNHNHLFFQKENPCTFEVIYILKIQINIVLKRINSEVSMVLFNVIGLT